MYHIGIDPGKKGGIAILSEADNQYVAMLPMPDGVEPLADALLRFRKFDSNIMAWVEKAQTMPKQGIVSAFSYGQHFGEILAILALLQIPYSLVAPNRWTKVMHRNCGVSGKDTKQKSRVVAKRLYPKESFLATDRSSVPHEGMVDAVLIARFGLQFGRDR
jgi:hypothetical protein